MPKPAKNGSSSLFDLVGMAGFSSMAAHAAGLRKRGGNANGGAPSPKNNDQDQRPSHTPGRPNPFVVPAPALKEFVVDNSLLTDWSTQCLSFRASKRMNDILPEGVPWGNLVIGVDEGDGWLRCGDVFLPFKLRGVGVLAPRRYQNILVPKRRPKPKPKPKVAQMPQEDDAECETPLSMSAGGSCGSRSPKHSATNGFSDFDEDDEDESPVWKAPKVADYPRPWEARALLNEKEKEKKASADHKEVPSELSQLVEKPPIEARLPALEPSHWLAPGGMRAPSVAPMRWSADDLQEAALRGDVGLVRKYVQAGVSVNAPIRAHRDDEFLTLLHVLACRPSIANGTRILVELLRARANPNVRSSLGSTPLMFACLHKNMGAVEVLLDAGAKADPVDDHGRTAARCAMIPNAEAPNSEDLAVELAELLAAAGADLNDGGSKSPIIEAVMQKNGPALRALIRLGATPDGLAEAALNAPVSMIQDLIEAEANPFVRDSAGKTVMEIALSRGEEMITTMLRDYIGDLERGGHPHLLTRTQGDAVASSDPNAYNGLGKSMMFDGWDGRKKHERRSIADRIVEQQMAASRPVTRLDRIMLRLQVWCKRLLKTYFFQTFMGCILALALFLPDLWVVANIAPVAPLDGLVAAIFVAFVLEFTVQLIGLQRSYAFQFGFWTDLLGCVTEPLDHSLVQNSIVSSFSGVNGATLARITKLVKLGARAGRLSRLVKLLRFLPGMGDKDGQKQVGTAKVMSKAINARLSVQVAALIIIMVIVLPVLDIFRSPTDDNSLGVWMTLLARSAMDHPDELGTMLQDMMDFYKGMNYWPYQAFVVFANGTNLTAQVGTMPKRPQDFVKVSASFGGSYMLLNWRGPTFAESLSTIFLISTIVLIMFTSALVVSRSISSVVLDPLEKLLAVVKDVAGSIFSSVDTLAKKVVGSADQASEDSDTEEGNEAQILEKVLKKLSALSELTVKKSPIDNLETLGVEDRALLADYAGSANVGVPATLLPMTTTTVSDAPAAAQILVAAREKPHFSSLEEPVTATLSENGIKWEEFQQWDFDTVEMSLLRRETVSICLLRLYKLPENFYSSRSAQTGELAFLDEEPSLKSPVASTVSRKWSVAERRASLSKRNIGSSTWRTPRSGGGGENADISFANFVMAVAKGYSDSSVVPYHNFIHAFDVAFTLHRTFKVTRAELLLGSHERLGLMASALAHDIGHAGYDNAFLINSHDESALLYNDVSPLENMSCAMLFDICNRPGASIFSGLERPLYHEVRRVCVEAILHTDNMRHFSMLKELQMQYDMNQELFNAQPTDFNSSANPKDSLGPEPSGEVIAFWWKQAENKKLVRTLLLHFADLSNPMKNWKKCKYWGECLLEEFFRQGDREREMGLPVHILHDRSKLNRPHAHMDIIEFCIAPFVHSAARLFPALTFCDKQIMDNFMRWAQKWAQESEETQARDKARERVSRMKHSKK